MSKDSSVVFKKSAPIESPARRKSTTNDAVHPISSPSFGFSRAADSCAGLGAQTVKATLPLADMPWSQYISRGACDLLSSSLNVAFDAVDSHDLRSAMTSTAKLTRSRSMTSPLQPSVPASCTSQTAALPRIATVDGAAPRMQVADFTLSYSLPQLPAWKLGFTPRFPVAGRDAAVAPDGSSMPRDLTERAMEVDLRLPSPAASSVAMSCFTACANERAARVQTALDRNTGPTKWEAGAAAGGVDDGDSPEDDHDEPSDWSLLLSLAQSRREQASQKLKEMDEQLQVEQQLQRRSKSLRTPVHDLVTLESKDKVAGKSSINDAFAASLLPEDLHTGLPMFFMRSSDIYARIRAIRSNPARREEQRALAEEIMRKRKGLRSPVPAKEGAEDPIVRNKLHAAWSKATLLAHLKEAAAKERLRMVQVICSKKRKDEERRSELEDMITRKEARRRALAEEEERVRSRERLQALQTKWLLVYEMVRSLLCFRAIFHSIEQLRRRDSKRNQAALVITKFFATVTFMSRSKKLLQVKRILRRSMWIPLMNIRIHRKKKACHLISSLMDVMHARRYGVYAVMLYRARILKVQRFLKGCIAVFRAQVAMNVIAAAAFVDVSERIIDIIKRRVKGAKKGASSKEHSKNPKDSRKAVSLSHLQSSIADTMANEGFQLAMCRAVSEQLSRQRTEHFRRFRDYLRAMRRSVFKSVGSGGLLDTEAQQKVLVRVRRAVLEELSTRQHAALARAMKVHVLPLALFTRRLPVLLSNECLKECMTSATQNLLASMPQARVTKAHEAYYSQIIASGSAVVYSWLDDKARQHSRGGQHSCL